MLKRTPFPRHSGVTLIELMIVIVIMAVLLALAVPAFMETIDRNRLKSVAETLLSDLELMKLESIKRSAAISLSIRNDNSSAGDWCYGMSEAATCDCKAATCTIDGVSRVVSYTDFKGVIMTAPTTASPTPFSFRVEQVRGQVTLSTALPDNRVRLTSTRGKELDIEVSALGRFIICSPSGSANVTGYPTCS
jgi:type IV fimbrial biogenesis protein FimT